MIIAGLLAVGCGGSGNSSDGSGGSVATESSTTMCDDVNRVRSAVLMEIMQRYGTVDDWTAADYPNIASLLESASELVRSIATKDGDEGLKQALIVYAEGLAASAREFRGGDSSLRWMTEDQGVDAYC